MIPIKILCGCGQKYSFEAEPAVGQLQFAVACPICGADGAAAAQQVIAQHLAAQAASTPRLQFSAPKSPPLAPPMPAQPFGKASRLPSGSTSKLTQKSLVTAISGVVVLALICTGALWFRHSRGQSYGRTVSGGRGIGNLPQRLGELNAWYPEPPAGQNAATVYLRGFGALQTGNASPAFLPLVGAPLSAPARTALRALVQSNHDALESFAAGTKLEQSRYPVDLSRGCEAVFPHLPKVKGAIFLMEVAAVLDAEEQRGQRAAEDVLVALGLARSLEAEPSLVSQYLRASGVSVAVAALEQTLNRTALARESLSDLSRALQGMELRESRGEAFNGAIAAERVSAMALLGAPQKLAQLLTLPGQDIPAEERDEINASLQRKGELKEEQQYFEAAFHQLMSTRKQGFPERLKADELIRQQLTEAGRKHFVTHRLLLPSFAGNAAKEASSLARLRLGMTATALEQFRAAHEDHYPADLTVLTPEQLSALPVDPFDGQPLRYQAGSAGYVLYSIGPDLKDDSGARLENQQGDLVFEVVSPAGKRQ